MGVLHAVYGECIAMCCSVRDCIKLEFPGLGALSSPLVATQFSQLPRWSFHYLVSLGVALTNTVILAAVFKGKSQHGQFVVHFSWLQLTDAFSLLECLQSIGQATVAESESSSGDKYRQIMRQKVLHLLAFWGMLYVGIEVTIGG